MITPSVSTPPAWRQPLANIVKLRSFAHGATGWEHEAGVPTPAYGIFGSQKFVSDSPDGAKFVPVAGGLEVVVQAARERSARQFGQAQGILQAADGAMFITGLGAFNVEGHRFFNKHWSASTLTPAQSGRDVWVQRLNSDLQAVVGAKSWADMRVADGEQVRVGPIQDGAGAPV